MKVIVKCKACGWEGYENELSSVTTDVDGKLEVCPTCADPWNLEDNELEEIHDAIMRDVFDI